MLASFAHMGIGVPAGSRLWRMCNLFVNKDGSERRKIKASDPDCEVAIEAGRDLVQFAFIFDALPAPVLAQFKIELTKAIGDQALPQHSLENSFGRDSQFHLYVASITHNAGFAKVRNAEPDVVGELADEECGFAAKRIKSVSNLRARIKKASVQIAKTKRPGLIVLETSLAFNRTNSRITQPLPEAEFARLYYSYFQRFISHNQKRFESFVDPWWVCGIVFHDQQIRLVGTEWQIGGMTFGVPLAARCISDPGRFWRQYEQGLPNRMTSPIATVSPRLWLPA